MIYDLRYTGVHEDDNEQAHRVKTDEIEPHSDESLPDIGPHYVALFCWRKAKTGGATRLFSFVEAYNRLLGADDPVSAERLSQPYFWLPERKTPDGVIYYHPVLTMGQMASPGFSLARTITGGATRSGARCLTKPGRVALAGADRCTRQHDVRVRARARPIRDLQQRHRRARPISPYGLAGAGPQAPPAAPLARAERQAVSHSRRQYGTRVLSRGLVAAQ